MAQVKRSDLEHHGNPLPHAVATDRGYDAGGHIAHLQADLARRLASSDVDDGPVSGAERLTRFFSVAGGYVALASGYAAVALAIAYLV